MLSGVKLVPRDQLLSSGKGGGLDSEDDERRRRRRREKSSSHKRREKKRRENRRSRRRRRYSSDDDDDESGSDESRSSSTGEDEREEHVRRSKRHRSRRKRDNLDEEEEEEEEESPRRHRSDRDEEEDEEEGNGGESLGGSEIARKEMGLEWMLRAGSSRARKEEKIEEPKVEEVERANPKELNPYLKDNGSGYPDDTALAKGGDRLLSSSVVGDGGASWRLKALKRAKEQATREGRKLEEVVEERWGSLGNLAVSVATSRAAPTHAHLHAIRSRKSGQVENSEVPKRDSKGDKEGIDSGGRDYLRDVSSRHPEMRKPRTDSLPWKRNRGQNVSSEDRLLISTAISNLNKFTNDGSFMDKIGHLQCNDADVSDSSFATGKAYEQKEQEPRSFKERSSNEASSVNSQALSANQLAAKIFQLRMKGKHEEAEQLSREMEAMLQKQEVPTEMMTHEKEGSSSRHIIKPMAADRKKREDDADLHLAEKIMQNKQYNLSKSVDDEYDFDGDAPSKKIRRKNKEVHEENRSIKRHLLTQKERCLFCFENPSRPKHLVVAIGNFTYLMLPQFHPVVPGHCIILPLQHESATRTVDRNVWEEIRNFKKCLLKMFAKEDKDVVFMETVIDLAKQRRHCLIECIPIPYQLSKQAPMYFKKAIDESEDEWAQHEMKKLIPTSGNLRQLIPENFAYFHVEFGLDRGFVHVIDNESKFSSGFGLNVIRGMLRLPEEDMHRRRRHESVEKQRQAVTSFMQDWAPFDWTKQLD